MSLLKSLIDFSGFNLLLPFYHCIADETPLHIKHLYQAKSVKGFKNELKYIQQHFRAISLEEFIENKGKKWEKPVFHLTFDDAFAEIYSIAPILEELEIPATIFINPDFIDNKGLMYRCKQSLLVEAIQKDLNRLKSLNFKKDKWESGILQITYGQRIKLDELAERMDFSFQDYLLNNPVYLTTNQLLDLQSRGFTLGAHTMNHPFLNELSLEESQQQIKQSLDFVQNHLKAKFRVFSFPFSDWQANKSLMYWIENEVDVSFGNSHLTTSDFPFHFSRLPMESLNKKPKSSLESVFVKAILKKYLGRNKIQFS